MPTLLRSTIARAVTLTRALPGTRADSTSPRATRRRPLSVARSAARGEEGDVPGWVLVTLMTAGLVLAIWAVAGPALTDLFTTAIARVTSFGG